MKKTALFAMIAALALAGCRKEPETPDPYAAFKADATPRRENGAKVEKNEDGAWVFVTDAGGALFSSDSYKTGRMSADGSDYEIIEFDGPAEVGKPSGATIRKPSGTTSLHSLEIVQVSGGKLWIAFKETAASVERRIVQ